MDFQVGRAYTRADMQNILDVPEEKRRGDWLTGYTKFNGEIFILCNIGVPGRTGHDYPNRWDGDQLLWSAKTRTKVSQPLMKELAAAKTRVHIFHRSSDRSPFTYAGLGTATDVEATTPVSIRWSFNADALPPSSSKFMTSSSVGDELERAGFEVSRVLKKTWRASRGNLVVYIKLDSDSHVVVVDPKFQDIVTELKAVKGVSRQKKDFFYHNSNMQSFPSRMHTGASAIHYGLDFAFGTLGALHEFLGLLEGVSTPSIEIVEPAGSAEVDPRTESEGLRAIRLGQQRFRDDLLQHWKGGCALTGLAIPELLRASHIKAWALSKPKERLDVHNGLLLAVHIDLLFDRGFISFDQDGRVLFSAKLGGVDLTTFGMLEGMLIAGLTSEHQVYLEHHRARFGFSAGMA